MLVGKVTNRITFNTQVANQSVCDSRVFGARALSQRHCHGFRSEFEKQAFFIFEQPRRHARGDADPLAFTKALRASNFLNLFGEAHQQNLTVLNWTGTATVRTLPRRTLKQGRQGKERVTRDRRREREDTVKYQGVRNVIGHAALVFGFFEQVTYLGPPVLGQALFLDFNEACRGNGSRRKEFG